MREQIRNKLKSNTGASLMVALLLFILCAVVGSVILAAASSSAGRASRADTTANEQRYSLESAAQTLIAELAAEDAEAQSENSSLGNADFSLTESWNYHKVKANFAISKDASAIDLSGSTYHVVGNLGAANVYLLDNSSVTTAYSTDGAALLSYGDYVLSVDESWSADSSSKKTPAAYSSLSSTYSQLQDNADKNDSTWTDQWTGGQGDYVGTVHSGSPATIQEIRNQMMEALIRHDWSAIAQDTRSTDQSSASDTGTDSGTGTDPWNGRRPASLSYKELKAKLTDGYTVTTDSDNPLVINPPAGTEETILPVYADLSLDSTGRFVIHLTCDNKADTTDSSADTTSDALDTGSELWVIYEPDQNLGAAVTYTQSLTDPSAANTSTQTTNPVTTVDADKLVYQESYESQIQVTASSEKSARSQAQSQIKNACSDGTIYQIGNITSEDMTDPETGSSSSQMLYTVPYTVYTKEPAVTTTVTTYYRSVTCRFAWNDPQITQDKSTAAGTETVSSSGTGSNSSGS